MQQSTHKSSFDFSFAPDFRLSSGKPLEAIDQSSKKPPTQDDEVPSSERIEHVLQSLRDGLRETLRRTGTSCVRSRFDTSDIIQESLMQIWQQLRDGDMAKLEMTQGLLYVIAKGHANKLRRFHLSKKRDVGRETKSQVSANTDQSDPITHTEIREQLGRLFEVLALIHPARQFIVFRRFFDDASFREIAAELGRSKDWVRRQFEKSVREIRMLMTEY